MSAAEEWDVRTFSRSEAYDAWSRMLSATHLPWSVTELTPDRPSGFHASVRRRHLADLVLVECTCSPVTGQQGGNLWATGRAAVGRPWTASSESRRLRPGQMRSGRS